MASTVLTTQIIANNQTEVAAKLKTALDALDLIYANLIDVEIIPYGANQFVIIIVYHA